MTRNLAIRVDDTTLHATVQGDGEPGVAAALDTLQAIAPRVQAEGLEPVLALYRDLPSPIRERALAMAATFDPASVTATAAFLGSRVQPFDDIRELAAIRCPALVVPGVDPSHPRAIATAWAHALPNAVLIDQRSVPTADAATSPTLTAALISPGACEFSL